MTAIRSRKYLDGARGQRHAAEKGETARWRSACHRFLDEDWAGRMELGAVRFYVLRAMQRTLRNRVERGYIVIALDPIKHVTERQTKPRKPVGKRRPLHSNPTIPSRPMRHAHQPRVRSVDADIEESQE